jgi:hypothetical protein
MKKVNYLLAIIILCFCPEVKSQDREFAKNSLYFEFLGNGGLYSINYERALTSSLYARLGFGTWTTEFMGSPETKMTTIPVMINYITGNKRSHFEIGGGFLFGSLKENEVSNPVFDLIAFLGYRYQPAERGFLFRVGLTPFLSLNSVDYPGKFTTSIGISWGYHF